MTRSLLKKPSIWAAGLIVMVAILAMVAWRAHQLSAEREAENTRETQDASGQALSLEQEVRSVADEAPLSTTASSSRRSAPALLPTDATNPDHLKGDQDAEPVAPRSALLADVIEDLARRADQGERDAACRLAWDLDLCRLGSSIPEIQEFWVNTAAVEDPGSAAELETLALLNRIGVWAARSARVCRDLPADYLQTAAMRMHQAAMLGHAPSMARFALAPPFGDELTLEDSELIALHRSDALRFLEQAAAAGDPTGLFGLYHAYSRGYIATQYGNLPVERDPVRATAAGSALRQFADPATIAGIDQTLRQLSLEMDARQQALARKQEDSFAETFWNQPQRDFASGVFGPDIGETCVPKAD